MKIKAEHYATLQEHITTFLEERPLFAHHYKVQNLSEMRLRWDVLHGLRIGGKNGTIWVCDTLYPYLNDEHVDTALRRIFGHGK